MPSSAQDRKPAEATSRSPRDLTIVQALREAVREEMSRDQNVFVIGEDIRIGGSFLFTLGLLDDFGPDRVLNTPISETGFVGLAIGAAIEGLRPIVDFQYGDFVFTACDQIVQQATKLRYMSGGQVSVPILLQMPSGASGRGAQHANSMESFFFNVPGVKIVTPATPYDAKGLFKSALRDDNVVLFCVHKHLYGSKGRPLASSSLSVGHVPEEEYLIPLGEADVKRTGGDVTVVANSLMLHRTLNVVEALARDGTNAEVIDPRCLVPMDTGTIIASVEKTGRLVIVEEGNERGGWGPYVAAVVAQLAIGFLDAPIVRVAAPDVPVPFSPVLEGAVIPSEARIREAIEYVMGA
jgi:acetoin:2,6-dichlorophenolindophenol oxidoreductase subunit beta